MGAFRKAKFLDIRYQLIRIIGKVSETSTFLNFKFLARAICYPTSLFAIPERHICIKHWSVQQDLISLDKFISLYVGYKC